jgi:hypothetical protein
MSQQNNYFTGSIRNSYGYQDQPSFRPYIPSKSFQMTNNIQLDNKLSTSIKAMENRVDGVEALVRQKKNSVTE